MTRGLGAPELFAGSMSHAGEDFYIDSSANMFRLCVAELSPEIWRLLEKMTKTPWCANRPSSEVRLGRGVTERIELAGKKAIVRRYLHGGLLKSLLGSYFFFPPFRSLQASRPGQEFYALFRLSRAGLSVSRPLALWLWRVGFFYQALLVTEEIPAAKNLLSLCCEEAQGRDEAQLAKYCFASGREACRALAEGVLHCDLHLGNVLVDRNEAVYLIDFDRAKIVQGKANWTNSRAFLFQRWQRSLRRHAQGPALLEAFQNGFVAEEQRIHATT